MKRIIFMLTIFIFGIIGVFADFNQNYTFEDFDSDNLELKENNIILKKDQTVYNNPKWIDIKQAAINSGDQVPDWMRTNEYDNYAIGYYNAEYSGSSNAYQKYCQYKGYQPIAYTSVSTSDPVGYYYLYGEWQWRKINYGSGPSRYSTITCGSNDYLTSGYIIKNITTTELLTRFVINYSATLNGQLITPKIIYNNNEYNFNDKKLKLSIPKNSNIQLKIYFNGTKTQTPQINNNFIELTATGVSKIISNVNTKYNIENISFNLSSEDNVNMSYSLDGNPFISICNNCNSSNLNLNHLDFKKHNITFLGKTKLGNNTNTYDFETKYQYFYFKDFSNNSINNFTLNNINFDKYANIKLSDYGYGNHSFLFQKFGYEQKEINITFNETSFYNLTTETGITELFIQIYDIDNSTLINDKVDINLIGDSFSGKFETTNGKFTTDKIKELPGTYELDLRSEGYEDLIYYFKHTGYAIVNLSLYMQKDTKTIPIKYIILDNFGEKYDETTCLVKLEVYKISTNSYESFVMGKTNSIAEVIFNLDTSKRYKAIVTCGDKTQVFDGEKITSTPVYKKFTESNLKIFPKVPTISSDISFIDVNNMTGRFKFTYNDQNNIITEACLNITQIDYATEKIIRTKCLQTSSGSINIDFNKTRGLTYKAYGFVTYENEYQEINTYYMKIPHVKFNFGVWGVIFGLIIVGLLAIVGFFMGKAKGVLIGTTVGLWIMSFSIFGVWFMPISVPLIVWSVLLIVGVIFT